MAHSGLKLPPLDIPPVGDYWTPPKPSLEGDATRDPLFLAVGKALNNWENAEGHFASLFSLFIGAQTVAAGRVYGTILSTSGRSQALREASQLAFLKVHASKAYTDAWARLANHYSAASQRRNEITHGHVRLLIEGTPAKILGAYLMAPFHNTQYTAPPIGVKTKKKGLDTFGSTYMYTSANIERFAEKFDKLTEWAGLFRVYYAREYPRRP